MSKSTLAVQASASPAQVRAWANHQGFRIGTRGRLNPDVVKAYNKANHVKYVEGKHTPTKVIQVKDGRGRTVTRKVNVAAARALLADNGVKTGSRGRLSKVALAQAVSLSKV